MWVDSRLKFDPSQYSSINNAHLDSKKIWHPEFKVYNRYGIPLNHLIHLFMISDKGRTNY